MGPVNCSVSVQFSGLKNRIFNLMLYLNKKEGAKIPLFLCLSIILLVLLFQLTEYFSSDVTGFEHVDIH